MQGLRWVRETPRGPRAAFASLVCLLAARDADAIDTSVSGRISFGSIYRLEAADPRLLTALNAPLAGLAGRASGSNADDGNLNYRRHDAVSTALKGYIDLGAREGDFSALVRVKAWHDFTLDDAARPWGNSTNGYLAGAPLSDAGAPRLTQFNGVALMDAWVEHSVALGFGRLTGRLGQQSLAWGERSGVGGGLEALNARDLPAAHRAGAVPQELRVPAPMLFGRLEVDTALALEGFVGARFRPSALDMCGTFWTISDYLAGGCDKVMAGAPAMNDRARVQTGSYMDRLPTPQPSTRDAGMALLWKPASLNTELGLYLARYAWRMPMPSLRRSTRAGPPLLPGDPDGKNMRYFTEYPDDIALGAITFSHRRGDSIAYGEISYRPRSPFMLAPGDVLPAFLSPTALTPLRAAANAVAPGGVFHGFDTYAVAQAQFGVQHEWHGGAVPVSGSVEVVGKYARDLPDPGVRRYGRADLLGVGPVQGVCTVTTGDAARQCSQRGYATATAYGYRLRVEARPVALAPGLSGAASAVFSHDVKGWSGDFLLNEGRKTMSLTLRLEYRQRYLAELAYQPVWGGDYNPLADRDTVALSIGLRF